MGRVGATVGNSQRPLDGLFPLCSNWTMRVASHSLTVVPALLTALLRLCLVALELVAGLLRTRHFQLFEAGVSSRLGKLAGSEWRSAIPACPVIPAKAGIHEHGRSKFPAAVFMDPGFRRDDGGGHVSRYLALFGPLQAARAISAPGFSSA